MTYGKYKVGERGRGYYEERQWGGADATASEKATGIYLPHSYSLYVERIRSPKIKVKRARRAEAPRDAWAYEHRFVGNELKKDIWTSNHWNALLSQLYSEFKGGDFNATVATAQLGETLGSIASAATRIYQAYRFARKGQLRSAAVALTGKNKKRLSNKAATKEMANNWLELQYGWLPLLGDVHSGTELLANYLHRPFTRTVRVRRQITESRSGMPYIGNTFGDYMVRQRAQIVAYLTEDLSGYATLGLTDPYTVAWELLPYSFVLDWFLPIGPWLEAATAARTLKGTFVTTISKTVIVKGLYSGDLYEVQGGSSYYYELFTMRRDVSTTLSARLPSFKPLAQVVNLSRCLNALALLESLRR